MRPSRAFLIGLAVLAVGCSESVTAPGESPEPITALPRALTVSERAIIEAGNDFAIDLLRRIHTASPDSTVFLSPLSASMALGMVMNGAMGDTRGQMQEMLGFGDLSAEEINVSYRDLISLLRGLDSRVDLRLANAIFHRSEFVMEPPFLGIVRQHFDARIDGLDFDDPGAADHINEWVREATEDRIERMVQPPIDPTTVAFLMNAIYFEGDWRRQFDPEETYSGPFHLPGGASHPVRFMKKRDTLASRSTGVWGAIEIPYGGGAWVMTVAVPTDGKTLDAVVDDLENLFDPAVEWPTREVDLHLPRFQLEWERSLNDDLKALGTVDAFDELVADFTPMHRAARELGLHVREVKQKTFLQVDEEGTEAAAVTSVEMGVVCACGPPEFRADRPFLLAIRERLSGVVLFVGLIVEPPEG